jgi:hypothetical protein
MLPTAPSCLLIQNYEKEQDKEKQAQTTPRVPPRKHPMRSLLPMPIPTILCVHWGQGDYFTYKKVRKMSFPQTDKAK